MSSLVESRGLMLVKVPLREENDILESLRLEHGIHARNRDSS